MKNLKKTLAMISSVVMAGSMFAACGNDTTPATDSAADTTTAAADAAAGRQRRGLYQLSR